MTSVFLIPMSQLSVVTSQSRLGCRVFLWVQRMLARGPKAGVRGCGAPRCGTSVRTPRWVQGEGTTVRDRSGDHSFIQDGSHPLLILDMDMASRARGGRRRCHSRLLLPREPEFGTDLTGPPAERAAGTMRGSEWGCAHLALPSRLHVCRVGAPSACPGRG